ncbi:hypothetical protein MRB53_027184 [Persea americana]|uniref:Uncharacterized protein n=1 Tax=Persea americana TaxID=3435 RepID=A0ACC2LKE0_PERAE|nr:hypothetical protein MRB53_027184 [Persea americana]|eukprot:TRINITY_DN5989_c1_g1_i1.p1 TRINITY_DN5989_c1_g1~~TRINITY_DN5989_c1_g1_i1.p1  ORF type:complete len:498 (+),score=96.90 TRINITY_DN5989_c1_g1_i1:38-1531(+)
MDIDIQTLFFSLLPLLLILVAWNKRKGGGLRLPPGPWRLPIIGNLHQLSELPHRSLRDLAKVHGPLMYVKFGSIPVLVVSSADMAREVIKTYDLSFTGRPAGMASRILSYGCLDIAFSPYGEYWRYVRKICVQELLGAARVQSFRFIREKEVAQLMDQITRSASSGPLNMSEMLLGLTNGIICKAAFGSKYGKSGDGESRFQGILGESQAIIVGFGIADFFPSLEWINKVTGFKEKLDKVFRSLDSFFEEVIEQHLDPTRPKPDHEDFMDVMLRVQKDTTQGITLTRQHIKAVIMDMFLAGTDTTFATLVWAMTQLVRHPRVMKKAQEEVRRVVGDKKRVHEEDIQQMEYLKMVLKEVLRVHPPVSLLVPRECTEQCKINGYDIPVKTRLFVNLWAIMRDPELWEKPEEFWPERFQDSPFDFKGQNFQYIPFGSGRRSCPGNFFGVATAEVTLANLLHAFDWELPHGMKKEDVDMNEALGLALHKKCALKLVATPRV